MAILNVRQFGDNCLTKVCKPVRVITPRIEQLVEDMYDTMYEAGGVGLAAPQVGVLKRIVVIDVTPEPEEGEDPEGQELLRYTMINPEIIETSGEQTGYEGCLSLVGKSGMVTRPDHVKVRFTDLDGDECELEGEGLLARAICHECDHLEGVLYTSKVEGKVYDNAEIARMEAEKQENGAKA